MMADTKSLPLILVVDDDLEFLLAMRRDLAEATRDVLVAQQPQGALWLLERMPVDVLLCDLDLATSDGRHLLEFVRLNWPAVARILVTGFGDRATDVSTFPAAQAVVLKPLDVSHLIGLIESLPVL